MWFVVIGCLLVLLKIAGVTFVANWNWLLVLAPFALAAIWWVVADATGCTSDARPSARMSGCARTPRAYLDNMGTASKRGRPTGKPRVPSDG